MSLSKNKLRIKGGDRLRIKGGDTRIDNYLIHHRLFGVKDCGHYRGLKFHTLCIKGDIVQRFEKTDTTLCD